MTNFTDLNVASLTLGGAVAIHEDLPDTALISIKQGMVTLSKAGVVTTTLAKPTATTDDFKRLSVFSLTANAHTLAIVGGSFGNGGGGEDLATFGGAIGDGISLLAYQGQWYITGTNNITVT
jgi:hypothetical protein